ncbi:MAG: thiamine ABC transporter substrate-binding protein, partial [Actinomycetota bacterium]|nr:thiamine ABC transporter substrate-binding protein [Actinomycetota bacterium]
MKSMFLGGVLAASLLIAACSDDSASDDTLDGGGEPGAITLVAYDSFPTADTALNEALAQFSDDTGIDVSVVIAGDTGTMVTKAVLTAGNPEGDVMWGVDNTWLSAATTGGIFEGEPSRVDYGDVCVNYDVAWFS